MYHDNFICVFFGPLVTKAGPSVPMAGIKKLPAAMLALLLMTFPLLQGYHAMDSFLLKNTMGSVVRDNAYE
jgi:hypothetical protein